MHLAFLLPEFRRAENRAAHVVAERFVECDQHVLLDGHLSEQADVLEGSGDSGAHHLIRLLAVHAFAVQEELAFRGLVHAGQQVEHGGFAGAVRADQADELAGVDGHVEVGYGLQASEGDAEMLGLEDGLAHAFASLVVVTVSATFSAVSTFSVVFLAFLPDSLDALTFSTVSACFGLPCALNFIG